MITGALPRHRCGVCGEFLPHACAPVITRRREPFTGRRTITITDRSNQGERDAHL